LNEDFQEFYSNSHPDKIKLFQVLKPNVNLKHDFADLLINDLDFSTFRNHHSRCVSKIYSEDNNMMENSYFILNSNGCFVDNVSGLQSPSLLEKGITVEKALTYININMKKYLSRYKINKEREII
jgi:radical S-adenosyl methionine domain-containing protein 2